jgi:hypothetical protein
LARRVWVIPVVVVSLTVVGVVGAGYISVPTLTYMFDPGFAGETEKAALTVEGVRCYRTADFLREHIESVPGLVSMVTYAGRHRVIIEYSPQAIGIDDIVAAIESPVLTDHGRMRYFSVLSHQDK